MTDSKRSKLAAAPKNKRIKKADQAEESGVQAGAANPASAAADGIKASKSKASPVARKRASKKVASAGAVAPDAGDDPIQDEAVAASEGMAIETAVQAEPEQAASWESGSLESGADLPGADAAPAPRHPAAPASTDSRDAAPAASESGTLDLDAILHDMDLDALREARHADPFRVLGVRGNGAGRGLRVFVPDALSVSVSSADAPAPQPLLAVHDGLFVASAAPEGAQYRLHIQWPAGEFVTEDPYAFAPILSEEDLSRLSEGTHPEIEKVLGAHVDTLEGVAGVRFAVWAPNAKRVSVVGDFNSWDGRRHPMRARHRAGVWELFVPRIGAGTRYKFEILGAQHAVLAKADPVARQAEVAPGTASIVAVPEPFEWHDDEWMGRRQAAHAPDAPLSIYELHLGSWLHDESRTGHVWEDVGDKLIDYVKSLGFTHIELMPIMEHPFGGSWGYQPLGMFAPTARYGTPAQFAAFVDRCHQAGLGIILDWVPAHFPNDAHGLVEFDGTALYEYADPREGYHPDWNTMIYNLARHEVRNFMLASGLFWLREFHVDGLRVDAVASMLYRDYSRKAGEWIPNEFGGRENLESVDFLRALNSIVSREVPGAMMIAEESTAWPGVTAPAEDGGLGFHYKWNMGWMHDTLNYVECEPIYRRYHHNELTFGMVYAYSEKFILPLSHDEVVHGKGSLLGKMPGDEWQKFATLRAYYGFMFTHPGKKLLFMGSEIAQSREWNHDAELDWDSLADARHGGVQTLIKDLNALYRGLPALHRHDNDESGFSWVVGDDADNSVVAYLRHDGDHDVLVVVNMTPVPREGYRIGVPKAGRWAERLNTDASIYGGSDMGNAGAAHTQDVPAHGQSQSLSLVLPPLATIVLSYEG